MVRAALLLSIASASVALALLPGPAWGCEPMRAGPWTAESEPGVKLECVMDESVDWGFSCRPLRATRNGEVLHAVQGVFGWPGEVRTFRQGKVLVVASSQVLVSTHGGKSWPVDYVSLLTPVERERIAGKHCGGPAPFGKVWLDDQGAVHLLLTQEDASVLPHGGAYGGTGTLFAPVELRVDPASGAVGRVRPPAPDAAGSVESRPAQAAPGDTVHGPPGKPTPVRPTPGAQPPPRPQLPSPKPPPLRDYQTGEANCAVFGGAAWPVLGLFAALGLLRGRRRDCLRASSGRPARRA